VAGVFFESGVSERRHPVWHALTTLTFNITESISISSWVDAKAPPRNKAGGINPQYTQPPPLLLWIERSANTVVTNKTPAEAKTDAFTYLVAP